MMHIILTLHLAVSLNQSSVFLKENRKDFKLTKIEWSSIVINLLHKPISGGILHKCDQLICLRVTYFIPCHPLHILEE